MPGPGEFFEPAGPVQAAGLLLKSALEFTTKVQHETSGWCMERFLTGNWIEQQPDDVYTKAH